jgi:NAD(P)-dependent dehydrogenase (short-subunit alcohol dehydrogenase family)
MTLNKFNITKKIDLNAGAVGLLGVEHAAALLEYGAMVVLINVSESALSAAKINLATGFPNGHIVTFVMDVSKLQAILAVAQELALQDSRVDILVNNSAIHSTVKGAQGILEISRLENFPLEQRGLEIAVGLTDAFLCSQVFGAVMALDGKRGMILNIVSDTSVFAPDQRLYKKMGWAGNSQPVKPVTYSFIKAVLVGLKRDLATYWTDKGVRSNTLSLSDLFTGQYDEFVHRLNISIPQGRIARRSIYRAMAQFLCSNVSSYLRGQNVVIDGGQAAW